MSRNIVRYRNGVQIDGRDETINSVDITVILQDDNEDVLLAKGNTVPTDASAGYAKGAIFLHSDGSAGTIFYFNEGTTASSAFNPVTTPESDPAFLGDVTIGNAEGDTLTVDATALFNHDVTLGAGIDDTVILKGRVATSTVAGAALDIDDSYARNEMQEYKYDVSDWTNIPVNYDSQQQFIGSYVRSETAVDDAQGWLIGVQGWAVANGAGVSELTGVFGYAYLKGDTADTVPEAYGIRGEVSFDAGRSNAITITTEMAGVLSYITAGKVDDYTKIHAFIGRFGDMDGQARTFGSGLRILDGVEAGAVTLTNVIYTDCVSATFLEVDADGDGGAVIGAFSNDTIGSTANDGYLVVKVGATSYKVPFWDDAA